MATIHVFTILSVTLFIVIVGQTSTANPKGLVTRLIHRNSIYSPYHIPNETVHDRAKHEVEISIARLGLIRKRSSSSVGKKIQTNMVASIEKHLFLMKFSVGQPPVPQLALADTGSDIAWIKCFPCDSCSLINGDFDPIKSSTYSACHSCKEFYITYMDESTAKGVYIHEQLTFDTSDDGQITISDIDIGCAHEWEKFLFVESNGVFGLNSDSSFVKKFDHKLSYCVGNIRDTQYSFNQISFGDDAIFQGDSTPLQANHYYYLTLEGISLGGELLDINPSVFNLDPYNEYSSGVEIDSGSPMTWLARVAYHALRQKVRSILRGILTESSVQYFADNLCYYGSIKKDLYGFPVLAFHFAQGTDLVLDVDSMFVDFSGHFCLAFASSSNSAEDYQYENHTVIGMLAQQNYNVGYDIKGHLLYLQRIDCELLQD